MDNKNVVEDISAAVEVLVRAGQSARVCKEAEITAVELEAMRRGENDDLFQVMRVLAAVDMELIVIPKD